MQPAGQAPRTTATPSIETTTESAEAMSTADEEQKDNNTKARNSALASTGANVVMILAIAGLLILAGLVTMALRRRDKDE